MPAANAAGVSSVNRERLLALVAAKGWTQHELAIAAGRHLGVVARVLSGKTKDPSSSLVMDIARALGVSPEEILA